MQNYVDFINTTSIIFMGIILFYVLCGYVLIFFKKYTVFEKYFLDIDIFYIVSSITTIVIVLSIVTNFMLPATADSLSFIGFTFCLFFTVFALLVLVLIIVRICQFLKQYRDKIISQ